MAARALLVAAFLGLAAPAAGQEEAPAPILVIDQDRLFTESRFGQRVLAQIEERSAALAAENRAIEAELIAEERDLTERRPQMTPEEFRRLADAFDQKVQRVRDEQDTKSSELAGLRDRERQAFAAYVTPVLAEILRDRGALIILERRAVFIASQQIDVTDEVIRRIDAEVGDGESVVDEAPASSEEAGPDAVTTGE
ncbi:OmpH family outer membrane protein [Roseitranquillus sediminis]|uniref:OmpH family outer membrane protein n=1 Tax=Roseitranquillus sediminis TaxID=2809051 RepID=UPI001D0C3277|nr:OmpH family outer membrane protein [Roseitranquillus sediminis]MBM9595636.1 OmpH family outer membrane protein [Roseitranquillus sediminis]